VTPAAGTTALEHTVAHEVGHFLDFQMTDEQRYEMRLAFTKAVGLPDYVYGSNAIGDRDKIAENLSRYGASFSGSARQRNEVIAEGWAEYVLSDRPRPGAVAVGETILKYLGVT